MTAQEALEFVRRRGIVLMSARGPVPSLAEAIAGGPIRGSWWAHPRSHLIYKLCETVSDSAEVVVCRLVDGKVTFVHRLAWPAVVRLSDRFPKERLAAVRQIHTEAGKHVVEETPFPRWVPQDVLEASRRLGETEAIAFLGEALVRDLSSAGAARPRRRARGKPL